MISFAILFSSENITRENRDFQKSQFLCSGSCFLHPGNQVFACDTYIFFVFGYDAFSLYNEACFDNLCIDHVLLAHDSLNRKVAQTALKTKFSIKDFFSICDQICRKQRIWSHSLRKSLMENYIFCAVITLSNL